MFIESSFTLSLSVHVISCSCTYIYIYMQLFPLLRKTREVHKSNACLVLHRVIRSSPSNSSFPLTCGFITAVRNASLL